MKITPDQCREALRSPRARAFLRVIREGETSQTEDAYRWLYGSTAKTPKLFDGFADHPRVKTYEAYDGQFIKNGKIDYTTAAGAYQILESTWDGCAKALGLPDFGPESQDLAAVYLIRGRGALDDVLAGNIEAAIGKCGKEWASLPGSPYGQPTMTTQRALSVYERWLVADTASTPVQIDAGETIDPAPIPAQPAPASGASWPFPHANRPPRYAPAGEADPSPYIAPESAQEAQVGPFGATLIGGLANSVVTLMQPLLQDKLTRTLAKQTDPAIAAQVAANLIESAKRVTGKDDPIEAVAAVKATPRAVQAIEADVLADLERMAPILEKVAQWDRDSRADDEASRAAAAARAQADTFDAARPLLTWSFSLVVLCAVALVVVAVVQAAKTGKVDNEILLALVGFLTWAQSKAGTIVDYRFGTSRSSSAKDVVITELSRRKTGGQP